MKVGPRPTNDLCTGDCDVHAAWLPQNALQNKKSKSKSFQDAITDNQDLGRRGQSFCPDIESRLCARSTAAGEQRLPHGDMTVFRRCGSMMKSVPAFASAESDTAQSIHGLNNTVATGWPTSYFLLTAMCCAILRTRPAAMPEETRRVELSRRWTLIATTHEMYWWSSCYSVMQVFPTATPHHTLWGRGDGGKQTGSRLLKPKNSAKSPEVYYSRCARTISSKHNLVRWNIGFAPHPAVHGEKLSNHNMRLLEWEVWNKHIGLQACSPSCHPTSLGFWVYACRHTHKHQRCATEGCDLARSPKVPVDVGIAIVHTRHGADNHVLSDIPSGRACRPMHGEGGWEHITGAHRKQKPSTTIESMALRRTPDPAAHLSALCEPVPAHVLPATRGGP
jgi:hypothetical protein